MAMKLGALAAIAANGQLLAFARSIVARSSSREALSDDVAKLCRSLARWHERLELLSFTATDLAATDMLQQEPRQRRGV